MLLIWRPAPDAVLILIRSVFAVKIVLSAKAAISISVLGKVAIFAHLNLSRYS